MGADWAEVPEAVRILAALRSWGSTAGRLYGFCAGDALTLAGHFASLPAPWVPGPLEQVRQLICRVPRPPALGASSLETGPLSLLLPLPQGAGHRRQGPPRRHLSRQPLWQPLMQPSLAPPFLPACLPLQSPQSQPEAGPWLETSCASPASLAVGPPAHPPSRPGHRRAAETPSGAGLGWESGQQQVWLAPSGSVSATELAGGEESRRPRQLGAMLLVSARTQRGESGQLLATVRWIDSSISFLSEGGLGEGRGTVGGPSG